ncbi:MAG: leucyl aminopeptidase [Nanoarchaeota archaeon]|nr:leucyl aminopeptidase [Nanoarchaeota archaeon]
MIRITCSQTKPERKEMALVRFEERNDSWTRVLQNDQIEIVVGIGKKKEFTERKLHLLPRKIIALAKANRIKKLGVCFEELEKLTRVKGGACSELLAKNFELANFEFIEYKTKPEEGWRFVEEIIFFGNISASVKKGVEEGLLIAEEINACRRLANTPGGEMTPKVLAKEAEQAAKGTKVKVTVLEKAEIKKLKMGGILGVAEGSKEEPKFIIMEYAGKAEKPIVLVGKGVTFDTGGLSLKPEQYMNEMHMDMSGGAAAIHAIVLAAKLKLKKHIVALIPAVENMPSGSSYRPGDILRAMSGKTIEVLNTDAEGRIILADALTYAKKFEPRLVIDVATLTGSAMGALGQRASAFFTKDDALAKRLIEAGERAGDYVWRLPLWEEYGEEIQGTFGDIINTGKTRYGGAITAAMFLYEFAKDLGCPWAHIDMAPRMTSIESDCLAKGAAGAPVGLLIEFLKK